MADESELARFREEWKQEMTSRKPGRGGPLSASAVGPSSPSSPQSQHQQHHANNAYRPKRPSFSHIRPADHRAPDDLDGGREPLETPIHYARSAAAPAVRQAGTLETALGYYEQAVQKEGEGNLGESLQLYRKAFKMDEKVDKMYKDKHFSRKAPAASLRAPTAGLAAVEHVPKELEELVRSFSRVHIEATPTISFQGKKEAQEGTESEGAEEPKEFSLLAAVPAEILLHIMRLLVARDVASFVRLAQVCKRLAFIVFTEQKIWQSVCESTYASMAWDWKTTVHGHPIIHERLMDAAANEAGTTDEGNAEYADDSEKRPFMTDLEALPRYDGSWMKMFHLRPRIRYGGVYISTCNYIRPGGQSSSSITWNSPVHIVVYYRYLRFYSDGTVLSLLTTHEPSEVVYNFSKHSLTPAHLGGLPVNPSLSSWAKHVGHGRWRMDAEGKVDVEIEIPGMERYLFRYQLRIKNVRSAGTLKGPVKLNWEGLWSWNKLTDDLAEFAGRNDKPFYFSRVTAVEKELAAIPV